MRAAPGVLARWSCRPMAPSRSVRQVRATSQTLLSAVTCVRTRTEPTYTPSTSSGTGGSRNRHALTVTMPLIGNVGVPGT